MYCRNCGAKLSENALVCTACGVLRGRGNRYCWSCSNQPGGEAVVCTMCGARLSGIEKCGARFNSSLPLSSRSKVTAGILGLLLGSFGVHRFYLGFTTIGVIQILVTICTIGWGGIWGTVEGILILCEQMRTDAEGRTLAD
ncbi:MAG: TM2 domain-containing protein [Candidatus Eremiobacteraeota bacterium]|nr:TM2 domain-containing protein [Candidatus Eremiobacteraeota bacterium]